MMGVAIAAGAVSSVALNITSPVIAAVGAEYVGEKVAIGLAEKKQTIKNPS